MKFFISGLITRYSRILIQLKISYYRIFELNINIKTKLIELNTYKNLPRIYIKIDKIFIPKTKLICEYLCESWQHLYKYFVYFRKCMFMLQTEESNNNE